MMISTNERIFSFISYTVVLIITQAVPPTIILDVVITVKALSESP